MPSPFLGASSFSFIQAHVEAAVLTITLDRPEVLNALHLPAHQELSGLFDLYAADSGLRVAIITGSGDRGFCVGTDLKSLAATGPYPYPRGGFAGITRRFDLFKPLIAAVNGHCMGGGVEILASCDLAVASSHAEFSLPEPLVGQAAVGGSALQRLTRQVPLKEAMWLALTGQRIDAARAQRMGLLNEVVPKGMALARAQEMARAIVACAPLSVEATKEVMLASLDQGLQASIEHDYPGVRRMLASDDAREGPRAFAEKRPPRWIGR